MADVKLPDDDYIKQHLKKESSPHNADLCLVITLSICALFLFNTNLYETDIIISVAAKTHHGGFGGK